MDNDLISIIVPIYNVEKYLNQCINSLVSQTYNNIEILLVDDGSTDSSGQIAELWREKDSRIKVFHKKNGGLSDARNYGINKSNGKYISFVDSDDYVDARFIEILYTTIIENNTEISIVNFQKFSSVKELKIDVYNSNDVIIYDPIDAITHLYSDDLYGSYAWNKLYLRTLFDNIKYPVGKKMEDLGTTYLLFDNCNKISYNPVSLYFYYQRENSICNSVDKKFIIDHFELSKERYLYIKDKYPLLFVNYMSFFNMILYAYPFISKFEQKYSRNEIKILWKKVKKHCKLKLKIKYLFFWFLPFFYTKLVKIKKKNIIKEL